MPDFNRAIELDPKNAEVYPNRGKITRAERDLAGAMAALDRALTLKVALPGRRP